MIPEPSATEQYVFFAIFICSSAVVLVAFWKS
jgi:hypothetical protein